MPNRRPLVSKSHILSPWVVIRIPDLQDCVCFGFERLACALASIARYDLARQLGRRAITEIPADLVSTFPFREWVRLLTGALDRSGRLTDLVWEWAEPGFDLAVSRRLHGGRERGALVGPDLHLKTAICGSRCA